MFQYCLRERISRYLARIRKLHKAPRTKSTSDSTLHHRYSRGWAHQTSWQSEDRVVPKSDRAKNTEQGALLCQRSGSVQSAQKEAPKREKTTRCRVAKFTRHHKRKLNAHCIPTAGPMAEIQCIPGKKAFQPIPPFDNDTAVTPQQALAFLERCQGTSTRKPISEWNAEFADVVTSYLRQYSDKFTFNSVDDTNDYNTSFTMLELTERSTT